VVISINFYRNLKLLMVLFCTTLFITHFFLVIISNLPVSALTHFLRPVTQYYIEPYFDQRWTFFAPQPINKTETVVARAEYSDGNNKVPQVTAWSDINESLVTEIRRSRFSPLAIVQLSLSNATVEYVNQISHQSKVISRDPNDPNKIFIHNPIPVGVDPIDRMVITRTAMASLAEQYPDKTFTRIQIGITVHELPDFEHRFDPDDPSKLSFLIIEWQQAPQVSVFCCNSRLAK
jgi:hypothetical protein